MLLDQRAMKAIANIGRDSRLTADGAFYVYGFDDLFVTSTATLETSKRSFPPFDIRQSIPLPNPDLLYLEGFVHEGGGTGSHRYVYSMASQTFAPVDESRVIHSRIVDLAPLRRVGLVSENRLTFLDSIPTLQPLRLEEFQARLESEHAAVQARMDEQERLRQEHVRSVAAARPSSVNSLSIPPQGGRSLTNAAPAIYSQALPPPLNDSPMIEAIGIDRASNSLVLPGGGRAGVVVVQVGFAAGRPVVLVLSSREAVHWNVTVLPGAKVRRIILSGPRASEVNGAGAAEITRVAETDATRPDSDAFQSLQAAVKNLVGGEILHFQGMQEGGQFTVPAGSASFRPRK
jgi:hypothetical protein